LCDSGFECKYESKMGKADEGGVCVKMETKSTPVYCKTSGMTSDGSAIEECPTGYECSGQETSTGGVDKMSFVCRKIAK
jgi:hypothetical protein